ncbi:MAG TPA: hypothetical protein PKH77_09660 [Anaerolineae bacterium]|nr:hypothetical protein [Anaerolineae bacterium]
MTIQTMVDELAALHNLEDAALWAAAQPSLSPAEQLRLSQLNDLGATRMLTAAEASEQQLLLFAYQRSILRRAQALAILTQRGYPLPVKSAMIPDDL